MPRIRREVLLQRLREPAAGLLPVRCLRCPPPVRKSSDQVLRVPSAAAAQPLLVLLPDPRGLGELAQNLLLALGSQKRDGFPRVLPLLQEVVPVLPLHRLPSQGEAPDHLLELLGAPDPSLLLLDPQVFLAQGVAVVCGQRREVAGLAAAEAALHLDVEHPSVEGEGLSESLPASRRPEAPPRQHEQDTEAGGDGHRVPAANGEGVRDVRLARHLLNPGAHVSPDEIRVPVGAVVVAHGHVPLAA